MGRTIRDKLGCCIAAAEPELAIQIPDGIYGAFPFLSKNHKINRDR